MDKTLAAIFATAFLLGCSTPPPEGARIPVVEASVPDVPPPEFRRDLPLEPPMVGHICKLGTSCMALDERPFELCLVGGAGSATGAASTPSGSTRGGTKRCVDKANEPLLVDGPPADAPPRVPISGR